MSEYDETQLFPNLRLVRLILERLGKNSLSVSVEVAAVKILEAQRSLEQSDAEIAELKGMLKVARCPNTTCSDGILCVGPEIEPCQWCYEVSQFINP